MSSCHLCVSVCVSEFLSNSTGLGVSEFGGILRGRGVAFCLRVYFLVSLYVCIQGEWMTACGVSLTGPWSLVLANPRPWVPSVGPGPPSPGNWGGGRSRCGEKPGGEGAGARSRRRAGGPTGRILPSADSPVSLHLLPGDGLWARGSRFQDHSERTCESSLVTAPAGPFGTSDPGCSVPPPARCFPLGLVRSMAASEARPP